MKYAAKKLGLMLLTMLIVSFLAFLAFQIIPGDPTNTLLGSEATPERVAALRSELGLDRPFFVRYFDWIVNFVQGDFGKSYSYSMPVADMLRGKLAVTLLLAANRIDRIERGHRILEDHGDVVAAHALKLLFAHGNE